tara:strand:- start:230 stop:364 length:135 start_codon:yes stop_codon:yes gene_type:complete
MDLRDIPVKFLSEVQEDEEDHDALVSKIHPPQPKRDLLLRSHFE